MAKDDYFVIAYKILSYLYACMKAGQTPDLNYLHYDTEDFPVCRAYWNDIFSNLIDEGYIKGIAEVPVLGQTTPSVKLTEKLKITPAGIAYIQENSMMQRAKNFLKEIKETIPGL